MVIEVTKRYIIGDYTLENIMNDYSEYYDEDGGFTDFTEFLGNFLDDECYDEKIVNGDIKQLEQICKLQIKLDKLKEKLLS